MAHIKESCPDAIFDVALTDANDIAKVPDGVKMLVFKGVVGDFSHIEGIVAALRALHLQREQVMPSLLRIYAAMKGAAYEGKMPPPGLLDDPREFARAFIFDLPPVTSVPVNDIPKLNARLLVLLTAA
jgi:hypothetical protein